MADLPGSLRVAVVTVVVIIVVFFAVAFIFLFLFVLFLVRLLSKEDIDSYRPIRRVRVETFWMYAAHAQWYPCKSVLYGPAALLALKGKPSAKVIGLQLNPRYRLRTSNCTGRATEIISGS